MSSFLLLHNFSIFEVVFQQLENLFFFTATINNWQKIIDEPVKKIILNSFSFAVQKNWCDIHAFVIMPNHIHLVLSLKKKSKIAFQRDFLKFVGREIIFYLKAKNKTETLVSLESKLKDRNYHIWKKRAHWITIPTLRILNQKIEYIHQNPLQEHWNLASYPEEYPWSSAAFYELNEPNYSFLTHYE